MTVCTGRGGRLGQHCCWIAGEVCQFLVDNGTHGDARFRCELMLGLGDWDKVHADLRYEPIGRQFALSGTALCGHWQPKPGTCCLEVR